MEETNLCDEKRETKLKLKSLQTININIYILTVRSSRKEKTGKTVKGSVFAKS